MDNWEPSLIVQDLANKLGEDIEATMKRTGSLTSNPIDELAVFTKALKVCMSGWLMMAIEGCGYDEPRVRKLCHKMVDELLDGYLQYLKENPREGSARQ